MGHMCPGRWKWNIYYYILNREFEIDQPFTSVCLTHFLGRPRARRVDGCSLTSLLSIAVPLRLTLGNSAAVGWLSTLHASRGTAVLIPPPPYIPSRLSGVSCWHGLLVARMTCLTLLLRVKVRVLCVLPVLECHFNENRVVILGLTTWNSFLEWSSACPTWLILLCIILLLGYSATFYRCRLFLAMWIDMLPMSCVILCGP